MGEFSVSELHHEAPSLIGAGFHLGPYGTDVQNVIDRQGRHSSKSHEGELNDVDADIHQSTATNRLIFHTLSMVNGLTEFCGDAENLTTTTGRIGVTDLSTQKKVYC